MEKLELNQRERYVASFLDDMLRFGAAIGSWLKDERPHSHHQRMAIAASGAACEVAAIHFLRELKDVDEEIVRSEETQKEDGDEDKDQ